ncbi:terpenoid synthase [Aspergillus homomorphus CBS 101889]|uniref:Bifunctional lycopene cyclase/phytoene synthase n=1 Tax=Aspergillus homomorphus (strain CBS 101889) TaxID=1450537 RepID=A0A395HXJ9_ASPHC|nr:terpenoid synthase [Aspergillus homomorphus CBS 101889]RAL12652.1 terpenoid synthase [Aspergillus homomorphus CBS 101889]
MGTQYMLFHCVYTIPVAAVLAVFYYPFFTARDICKIVFLNILAVTATIPWASYLIRHHIWTYPPDATINRTLFDIPAEEIAFFVLQTCITSLVYCICTKPLVQPMYLQSDPLRWVRNLGGIVLLALLLSGAACFVSGGRTTYMGLILLWALPVILVQWTLVYPFIVSLPWRATAIPILLPTVYFWLADRSAMAAGFWSIVPETQLNMVFFLITNVMIVFGLVGFDYAFALADYEHLCTGAGPTSRGSVRTALRALVQRTQIQTTVIAELQDAVARLHAKSQSMFVGSALFQGALRIDLIYLYSFCHMIDDLIDEARDEREARHWIAVCRMMLDARTTKQEKSSANGVAHDFKRHLLQRAVNALPVSRMSAQPLYDLLKGFEMDLAFSDQRRPAFPIATEADLDRYAAYVASTVAQLVLDLIHHYHNRAHRYDHEDMARADRVIGQALQFINIARDIHRDAAIGRVYIPTEWLEPAGLTPANLLHNPTSPAAYQLQTKLLDKADVHYLAARDAIERLPPGVREPVRTTVESYVEIGRYLRERHGHTLATEKKMRLPLRRRLKVAWLAML